MKVTTREYMRAIMDERDRRYEERFRAQEEAIRVRLEAQQVLVKADNARHTMMTTLVVGIVGLILTVIAEVLKR